MLKFLRIKNFAIIESLSLKPKGGLNVLSGETGSGKSILIGAVGLLRGDRAKGEQIRSGSKKAIVEGIFSIDDDFLKELEERGFDIEGDEIIIRREISQSGGKIFLNDSPITLKSLREIGNRLIEIHGQFDTPYLLNPSYHLKMVDESLEDKRLLYEVEECFKNVGELREKLSELREKKKERLKRIDILKFQIEEIEGANLSIDEEEKLRNRRDILKNFQRISEVSELVSQNLYDADGSAYERLSTSVDNISDILGMDKEIDLIYEKLKEFKYEMEYISDYFKEFKEKIDYSEGELDEIEGRLNLIEKLKSKYGETVEDVLNYCEKIKRELSDLQNYEEVMSDIERQLKVEEENYLTTSKKLSNVRVKKAGEIEKVVNSHLKDLGFERAEFKIDVRFRDENFTPYGKDEVYFLIKTNVGEEFMPLHKIASGGELSRIMLALKLSLKPLHRDTLLIFDEIDTGIGGKIAEKVGRKLKEVGEKNQTFCVTHLPQVASRGHNHFLIKKEVKDGRTVVSVKNLSDKERVLEIARMLAGEKITESAIKHARELLKD